MNESEYKSATKISQSVSTFRGISWWLHVCSLCLVSHCFIWVQVPLNGLKMELTKIMMIFLYPFLWAYHIILKQITVHNYTIHNKNAQRFSENYIYISINDLKWFSSEPWWNEKHLACRTAKTKNNQSCIFLYFGATLYCHANSKLAKALKCV